MRQLGASYWAGIDVGKGHHWVCLIDDAGTTVWSAKVVNDEAAILEAIGEVGARADPVVWGVDVTGTMSGLLLALLAAHGQQVKYVPGATVNRMATAYRGGAKTDARDDSSAPWLPGRCRGPRLAGGRVAAAGDSPHRPCRRPGPDGQSAA